MARISIIIPVYNSAKYLRKCLDSVFSQTYNDYEVIAINDGSADNSLGILNEYAKEHKNLKIIDNVINLGAGISRNRGIELATGDYVMFVDSDDYILPYTLEHAYKTMIEENADFVRYDFNRFFGKAEFDYRILDNSVPDGDKKTIKVTDNNYLFSEAAGPCNKLFSRELIGDTRFAEGIAFEDTPFTVANMVQAKKIVYLKENLYKYRFNPHSTMGNNLFHANMKTLDIFTSMDTIDKNIKDDKGLTEELNSFKLINCVHIINDLILWSELSLKKKKELYSYLTKLIELKYGSIEEDKAFNFTREHDSFFRKRMELMKKYIIKEELMQNNNKNELLENSRAIIEDAINRKI